MDRSSLFMFEMKVMVRVVAVRYGSSSNDTNNSHKSGGGDNDEDCVYESVVYGQLLNI